MKFLTLHCKPVGYLRKRTSRKLQGKGFLSVVVVGTYTEAEAERALREPFEKLTEEEHIKLSLSARSAGTDSFVSLQFSWVLRTAREDLAKEAADRDLQWTKDDNNNEVLEIELDLMLVRAGVVLTTLQLEVLYCSLLLSLSWKGSW